MVPLHTDGLPINLHRPLLTWTSEQILKLAPDAASAQAARTLMTPRKWSGLGSSETALWGACQGSGSKPYQTQIVAWSQPAVPAIETRGLGEEKPEKVSLSLD